MDQQYRHTQTSTLMLWATVPGALGIAVVGYLVGRLDVLLPLALALGALGWSMSKLTIVVRPTELEWYFGPGILGHTVQRADIAGANVVRNVWWYGWGIHRTPHGWLYNVAGLDAVEVTLRNGKRFRLGSDEAATLARALTLL